MSARRRKLLLAAAALVVLGVVSREFILRGIGSYLVSAVPPEKADLAVVLAGDSYGDRIKKGGDLVRQGFAPQALISGPSGMYGSYECDLAIPYAVKAGYPESYFVHAENDARSTVEEARLLLPFLRQRNARRVLLVTSDFHTRRAGRVFRATAGDIAFVVVAAPGPEFSPDGWWKNRQGRKVALVEWMKTVAEWLGI